MFGKQVQRHCHNCNETFTFTVSIGFKIDGKTYYNSNNCPSCNSNLFKEDGEIIQKATETQSKISVIMY